MASLGLGHSENNGITRSEDAEAAPEAVAGPVAVAAPEAVDANPVPVESDQINKALSDEDDVFESWENDDNKPKTPHFITDYYKSIPVKRITSAETVILSPSTSKDGKKRSESDDDRSLSIGFTWQSSSSADDSDVPLEIAIENYQRQERKRMMKDGVLPMQEKITKYMKEDDETTDKD